MPNPDDKLTKPCYDLRPFLDNFSWLDKVASCINDLGWDLYSFDHEDANGQYEFDFKYADALTTCDRLIFFRYMAKHYAKEEGLLATMMPKPFADKTGNGAHFNMSLYDLAERRATRSPAIRPTIRAAWGSPRPAIISSAASCGMGGRCAPPSRRR